MVIAICIACIAAFIWAMIPGNLRRKEKENLDEKRSLEDDSIFLPIRNAYVSLEELEKDKELQIHEETKEEPEEEIGGKEICPIPEIPLSEDRIYYLQSAFFYILKKSGEENVSTRKVYAPNREDFDFPETPKAEDIFALGDKIANIMEVDPKEIQYDFYESGYESMTNSTGLGGIFGVQSNFGINKDKEYFNKDIEENGKYVIAIPIILNNDFEGLVATLGCEFARFKFTKEEAGDTISDEIMDLVPMFYGLGIFQANSALKYTKDERGWNVLHTGYFSQVDWGYLLAMYVYHAKSEMDPEWLVHLHINIREDFYKWTNLIRKNEVVEDDGSPKGWDIQ